jgi:NAD(P)-dependent dehydrogenase (short-subunit alcohol dehydrogenase family)
MNSKIAVITGATKGIGRAISEQLWSLGYSLAICARSADDLKEMKQVLAKALPTSIESNDQPKILTQVCDVSQEAQVRAFAKTIHDNWGRVDLLVNNAGAFTPGKLIEEEDGTLEKLLNTNVMSAYWLTRSLLSDLRASNHALIVNISSIAGLMAYPPGGSYAVSKFALRGLSATLRDELKEEGIKVTTVFPGATWSASWEGVDLPKHRLMLASDVAQSVVGLLALSPQAVVEELLIRPQLGDL